jgi:hypothetical protein
MSRISHKYKFIFFSFPKTGSESVRAILDPYSDIKAVTQSKVTNDNPFYSHITPKETKQIFQEKGWNYDEYYKFTCVRNPYNRLISLYIMKYKIFSPALFAKWVTSLKPKSKQRGDWYKNGLISFHNFISDNDGTILVNDVIKLEEINTKLPQLLKGLGINIQYVPHVNKGASLPRKKQKPLILVDEETRKIIAQKYEWEIQKYGYTFLSNF